MTPSQQTRRTVLKAAGAGATVSALAFGGAASTTKDESLDEQLTRITEATSKYADLQVALEDGFQLMGPFVPGMGWHFINEANVQAAVENGFDIEKPQLLTYGDTGAGCDGELVLGSVEYAIPVGARGFDAESPPDVFNDEAADATEEWHVHHAAEHAFTLPVDPEAGLPEDFPESPADAAFADLLQTTNWVELTPGGEPGSPKFEHGEMLLTGLNSRRLLDARAVVGSSAHPDLWTLHVWVHHDNPDGVFTAHNPDLPRSPTD